MHIMTPSPAHHPPRPGAHAWMFRRILAVCDIVSVTLAWATMLAMVWFNDPQAYRMSLLSVWLIVATAVTVTVLSRAQLYRERVLAIRAVEVQRVGRSCLIAGVCLAVVDRMVGAPFGWLLISSAAALSYGLLLVSRAALQAWLREARRGHTGRYLLVVSGPDEAAPMFALLADRPELGYRIVGYVSTRRPAVDLVVPWLGTPADLALLTQLTAATGVLVAAGALEPEVLTTTVAELRALDVHVHLAIGDGDSEPDIRVLPLLHKTTAAVERPQLSSWQRMAKRAFDVVGGAALAIVAAPAVVAAAGLLKLATGGPVLVRDTRLGPRGEHLMVTRLRTSGLPPTRLATFVGRFCRHLCIDELPQLGNVLAGSMSLVGPRPRRPNPVPALDADQLADTSVAPTGMSAGLIGLRHVEARDYPEYGHYRRLDQFYAANWSLGLDVSIVAASAIHVLWRSARQMVQGGGRAVAG